MIFFVDHLESLHCHVCIIYFIPLYKIMVIDRAITNDSNILVICTIMELFLLQLVPCVVALTFVGHLIMAFHTVSTFSHMVIMVSWS